MRGYDQWSTVELFDQTKYGDVETVKAGTNWTGYDSMPMDRYATTVSTQGDEKQNDYWSQISKSTMIDENLHTGIITFSLNEISEKFTLGGYAEYENLGKQFSILSIQNYKLDLDTITNSNSLSYLAYGFADGTEFNLDADRAIPIVTNIKYDNNDTPGGLFATNFVEKTTVYGENGVVTANFKVADDASEEIQSVKLIASTDVKEALTKNRQTYYQGYLLGTYGNIYGDNIYNQDTKEFTIDFSGSDNSLSLMTGVDVQIITKENSKGYRAVLYLSESGLKMANYQDAETHTEYSVYSKYAPTASSLVLKSGDNADEYPVEQIKQIADGDNWKAYTFDLQDANGTSVTPEKGGYVEVPIPSEWNLDNMYVAYYRGTNKDTDSNGGSIYSGCSTIIDKNGKKYLRYKTLSNGWINGGTVVMCQVLKEANLSELQEDGTYSATVKFIKADTDSTLSMANGALETSAYVKIKDGKKDVYLNFHPITMNESEGWYAYLGAIWNKTKDDCTEYDYEVNEDGSLLDNSGFDAIDEFSCLKSVKVTLSDETITDNSYTFKVIPPAMGADLPYEKVSNDPIDANLKFYNVKKIDESTVQIPTYQKSVLRKSIDKAERYNESSYSNDSWATLKSALEDGKTYYDTLAGTDAGTDATISNAIKEKSDAIEKAIKSLKENPELAEARENLKNAIDEARKVELGNKTVSAFNELTAAINSAQATYEKTYTEESYKNLTDAIKNAKAVLKAENAKQSDIDAQVTLLQAAMDALEKEGTLDKKDLKAMIEKAEALNDEKDTYIADSWNALSAAYTAAVKVYQDENATQTAVDAQVKSLKAAMNALVKVSTGKLADGVYQITGEFQNATNPEKLSMADGALKYTEKTDAEGNTVKEKDPLYLVVKDGKASIRMHFVSLTSDLNGTAFTGYLGELKYYPDYDDTTKEPGKDEKLADAKVEASYEGYDEYNDPDFGSDSYMKGKSYPEIVSIPVELEDNEIWVQVYVPVMEGITAGSGTQNARLRLDWGSVKQVRDESVDISNLEKQIGYAKEVEQGKASDETWNALQQAIKSAQAVYDNLSSTQEQVDAQVPFLQEAMAAVQAENDQTADKTGLQALIAIANEKLAQTDVYKADSLQTLQTILTYAQSVYENKDADQTAVDAAANALSSAINSLKEIETVDTSALEIEIANAEELVKKTDDYTADSLKALQIAINNAKRVLASDTKTQESVDAQVKALKNVESGLIEKVVVDKTALKAKIEEAQKYAADTSTYTASSIADLKEAISSAQTIYNDENATQTTVDTQVKALDKAIGNLVKAGDNTQDITKLAEGVYSISGTMVKVDKNTYSMSNDAINHTIKLTVKNGKYYITMNFNGLTVGQKLGYLSQLKYFTTGYTVDKYGNPQGTLADVIIESYQKNADGTLVSDSYGTNYPDIVTFELISEALDDGFVPLQVFVPIMDAISSGTGTQPVFLKLDWTSLKATTSDDPDFDKNDNNGNNNNNNSNGSNNSSSLGNSSLGNNSLGSSSLGSSTLGSSSLGSGSSSLKSGTSSLGSGSSLTSASNVKTGDAVQNNTLWAAILLLGGVALLAGIMEYNRKKKANVK